LNVFNDTTLKFVGQALLACHPTGGRRGAPALQFEEWIDFGSKKNPNASPAETCLLGFQNSIFSILMATWRSLATVFEYE
jgi:hypothetical protein